MDRAKSYKENVACLELFWNLYIENCLSVVPIL